MIAAATAPREASRSIERTRDLPSGGTDGTRNITLLGEISIGLVSFARSTPRPFGPGAVTLYVVSVSICAIGLFGTQLNTASVGLCSIVLDLALLAALSEQANIKLTSRTEESISLLPMIFAAVLLGPLAAMFVGAASMLGALIPRPGVAIEHQRWVVYTATR